MLKLQGLDKSYDANTPVLHNIELTVARGEILCLLGPSGCGKTTLLRIVAGLEQPDQGTLTLNGQDLTSIPVHQRNFGLMFQEFALFPHRTVAENIAFGLRMAGATKVQIARRVEEVLKLVDLEGYGSRTIFALSGGERQRVALARSLAPNPRLLMLDEPLGSLDRRLRDELMTELRAILKEVGVTALYVTHDQQEAFALGDRVAVMQAGRIEQIGAPQQLYYKPANRFVARFLGFSNLLPIRTVEQPALLTTAGGKWHLPHLATAIIPDHEQQLLIRPDAVCALATVPFPPNTEPQTQLDTHEIVVTGVIAQLSFRGSYYRLGINLESSLDPQLLLSFDVPGALMPSLEHQETGVAPGQAIWLKLDPMAITLVNH
ncbi:MAG: ABC transporter ATP-binding protein [Caldilineaceae bacterium]